MRSLTKIVSAFCHPQFLISAGRTGSSVGGSSTFVAVGGGGGGGGNDNDFPPWATALVVLSFIAGIISCVVRCVLIANACSGEGSEQVVYPILYVYLYHVHCGKLFRYMKCGIAFLSSITKVRHFFLHKDRNEQYRCYLCFQKVAVTKKSSHTKECASNNQSLLDSMPLAPKGLKCPKCKERPLKKWTVKGTRVRGIC